jgi:hypothetical protein
MISPFGIYNCYHEAHVAALSNPEAVKGDAIQYAVLNICVV